MISDLLSSTEGVSIYPIIALVSFVMVFMGVVVWTIKVDKKYLNKMKNLPLSGENNTNNNPGNGNDKI
jgi:hypothetical protein